MHIKKDAERSKTYMFYERTLVLMKKYNFDHP